MNNLKVVGVFDDAGKHYDITDMLSGQTHRAQREGRRFKLPDGFVGSLKQCKEKVASNQVGEQETVECVFCGTSESCAACSGYRAADGTWDTVHPAALLAILAGNRPDAIDSTMQDAVIECLDCYGYIDSRGMPDADAGIKELAIWKKKRINAMGVEQ
jgi:hypothetical protein